MQMPRAEEAWIPDAKIDQYLLDLGHREGASKARFFRRFGFRNGSDPSLAASLMRIATEEVVGPPSGDQHGQRYRIAGRIECPDGRRPVVLTVWIVPADGRPRLVTAYPAKA